MDTYTKTILTIIAAALVVIAARGFDPIPPAQASDRLECTIEGPVEIGGFRDMLKVEVDQKAFEPGYSSGSPVFVKVVE